jgi:hypothetical protein
VAVMMVVTMRRFLSDGVTRKADRQSDRSDKAFHHGIPRIIEGCLTSRSRIAERYKGGSSGRLLPA